MQNCMNRFAPMNDIYLKDFCIYRMLEPEVAAWRVSRPVAGGAQHPSAAILCSHMFLATGMTVLDCLTSISI